MCSLYFLDVCTKHWNRPESCMLCECALSTAGLSCQNTSPECYQRSLSDARQCIRALLPWWNIKRNVTCARSSYKLDDIDAIAIGRKRTRASQLSSLQLAHSCTHYATKSSPAINIINIPNTDDDSFFLYYWINYWFVFPQMFVRHGVEKEKEK